MRVITGQRSFHTYDVITVTSDHSMTGLSLDGTLASAAREGQYFKAGRVHVSRKTHVTIGRHIWRQNPGRE
jgi:hypothetical protein